MLEYAATEGVLRMNSQVNAECGRCKQQKEKVFRIEANPSVAWGD